MTSKAQLSATFALAIAMCIARPAAAVDRPNDAQADYLAAITNMVAEQAANSASAAATIRDLYEPYVGPMTLGNFEDVEQALATGGLVRLPLDPRYNVRVRREGTNPIGEMDIAHQASYIAARAATIGCLLDVASQVKSGPIEVTSLVRHLDYQHQLRVTNANAATDIPMHTLGLAFDIAMVNTPIRTVLEIRDVLRHMSDDGAVLVIAERQQLVFHVVPQPSRLGWYSEVYTDAITGRPWPRAIDARTLDDRRPLTPVVTTAMGLPRPLPAWAAEWWAAGNVPSDLPVSVRVDAASPAFSGPRALMGGYFSWVGGLLSLAWQHTRL